MARPTSLFPETDDTSRLARLVPLDQLRLADWNPRLVKSDRLDNLRETILADPSFLWQRPICAQANGEVYAGNHRLMVMRQLWGKPTHAWRTAAADAGIAPGTVPAVVGDVPEKLAWERGMRDNANWASWEDVKLLSHMQRMAEAGSDLKLLGFDEDALKAFVPESPRMPGEEPPPVDVPEPVTRLGDVWKLGEHTLCCCNVEDDLLWLPEHEPRLVVADPPYGVHEATNRRSRGRSHQTASYDWKPIRGDDKPFEPSWLVKRFPNTLVLWGANHYADKLPASPSWLVWDKRDGTTSDDNADCELAWTNLGGPARLFRHLWRGMIKASEQSEQRLHPSQKPVALMAWLLEEFTAPGDLVLEPYCGSGPVLLASEQTRRVCVSAEVDPGYCDIVLARYFAATGVDPVRNDGATFSELQQSVE